MSFYQSGGNVADAATDSGNPVKIAGVYKTAGVVHTNGQRAEVLTDARGQVRAVLGTSDSTDQVSVAFPVDASGASVYSLFTIAQAHVFNGTTWDRQRGNVDGTAFASAARTASANSADVTNYNSRGVHVVIDVTAITATPSVTFTIQGKDALSGAYYTVLASAAITGVGTTALRVYPALTAAANTVANDVLPRTWRVAAVHGDADSITYSVGYSLIV